MNIDIVFVLSILLRREKCETNTRYIYWCWLFVVRKELVQVRLCEIPMHHPVVVEKEKTNVSLRGGDAIRISVA